MEENLESNDKKISTSIQYQLTNVIMFRNIFYNWENFNNLLLQGPNVAKRYLFQEWNHLKENLKDNKKLLIKDIDKNVTIDDFNITFNKSSNGIPVFFFTFPDYEYKDAASKYTALAITAGGPRYFTLEYSEEVLTHELYFTIGEFYINQQGEQCHRNYGKADNDRLTWFGGFIMGILEAGNN